MPDTVDATDATAADDGSTARKGSEETKELSGGQSAAEADSPADSDESESTSVDDATSASNDSVDVPAANSDATDSSSGQSTEAAAERSEAAAADSAASIGQQPKQGDTSAPSSEVPLSIRIGSPSDLPPKAAAGSAKPAKGKKSATKATKPTASPKKSSASKSPRPAAASSATPSAATTARKPQPGSARTNAPLTVAIDTTSQPGTARTAAVAAHGANSANAGEPSLAAPSPTLRPGRSPRSSITSALPSPSKQRTVEEVLAYWPLPTPLAGDGSGVLSPLFALVLDGRVEGVLGYIASIAIHDRLEAVNCYDGSGNSPLMYALMDGKQACLELLLDYGCDVNGVNERRNGALHLAVHHGWKRAMHTLIDYGANIKLENWEHQQPHQMHKSTDKQQTYLTLLNAAHEATQARLAAKQLLAVEREVRCYYRAVFDLLDVQAVGGLSWYRVRAVLDVVLAERDKQRAADNPAAVVRLTAAERDRLREKEKEAAAAAGGGAGGEGSSGEVDWVGKWFSELDVDHNGVLSFNEFLTAVVAWRSDMEKEQKKSASKGKGGKKKK